jgi:hypothetical protein
MALVSDREIADELLEKWHKWADRWRPNLGAPRIEVACREYRSEERLGEECFEDDADGRIHRTQMETVEFCVHSIDGSMQKAIGIEMRNREGSKVWRCEGASSYTVALDAATSAMRRRGLFD